MGYDIKVAPAFRRDFKKLPRQIQKKVIDCLDQMKTNPRPANVEKLSQDPNFWRMRIGQYRMVYAIDDDHSIVIACLVRHRRDVYRDIDKLDLRRILEQLQPFIANTQAEPSAQPPPPG